MDRAEVDVLPGYFESMEVGKELDYFALDLAEHVDLGMGETNLQDFFMLPGNEFLNLETMKCYGFP